MPLLEVTDLSHSFEYELFSNINFVLNSKESISIVGMSGSGKSTLLHTCATLLKPTSGYVNLFGKNLYKQSNRDILKLRREKIGIIFQSHYLFKGFDAFENIEFATLLNKTKIDNELIEKLGISNVLKQKVGELSGGQQQRVSIARVLSKKPKIIFADEPTGNLDSKTANSVIDILFEYIEQNDAALLLVTHDDGLANKTNIKCNL
ncbi:MAG: ABC transporter ATP-binding protein [Sulfurospirillum sp.]|nr:ABC transporter ATP-binding protein [Sulfurospirillum sp.]MBL0702852.1 ABC transporter ATP-binding protein [Sulfurospirillum sp.]